MAETLEDWIDRLQARGRYTFLRGEAIRESGLSPDTVKKALQRLALRRRVAKVKDYFYVIVPLEYLSAGAPPATWFIRDLMAAMKLPYYVALLSAAAIHGSAHQQPQEFHVLTDRSVRPVTVGRATIRFFASKYVTRAAVQEMKTPTGNVRVSTPETTAVDLVRFAKAAGHLNHVATVIAELSPSLDPRRLVAAVRMVGDVPNAQRLGYIFDQLRKRQLSDPIHKWVEQQEPRVAPLKSGQPVNGAREDRRWHLLINRPIEIEA
jgi:predicted transcriptional regulator of viral defense system